MTLRLMGRACQVPDRSGEKTLYVRWPEWGMLERVAELYGLEVDDVAVDVLAVAWHLMLEGERGG
jgi:hypothetical protein